MAGFVPLNRENSTVPLPASHLPGRSAVETLEARLARGDYTAIRATLEGCVGSLESWQRTLTGLPDPPADSPEGQALTSFKATVVPRLQQVITTARSKLPR